MNPLQSFSLYASALLLGALGAMFAGNGGLWYFGLEGVMLTGGLAGVMASSLPTGVPVLIAGAAGGLLSLLLGWLLIRWRADQPVAGVAANGLITALAMIVARLTGGFRYSRKAFQLTFQEYSFSLLLPVALLLLIVGWLLLFHTRWGLRLRACGKTPKSAENLGVSVSGLRLSGMMVSGFFCGVGGVAGLIALGGGWSVENGLGGLGFLALAAAVLGGWKPFRIMLAALLLAVLRMGVDYAASALSLSEDAGLLIAFLMAVLLLLIAERKKRGPEVLREL